jgi:hypothetical protein
MSGRRGFESFMFGMIAAKQARPSGADRDAARRGIGDGRRQDRVAGQSEIIVGREIGAGARGQPAQSAGGAERVELVSEGGGGHGRRYCGIAGQRKARPDRSPGGQE